MKKMRSRDVDGVLVFQDINEPDLILELYNLEYEDVFDDIHGVEVDENEIVTKVYIGIDVWLAAHEKMGYDVARLGRLPVVYQALKLAYWLVSKIRKYL